MKQDKGVETIVTYADRDLTPFPEDSVYFRNGFRLIKDSGPTLSYYCQFSVNRDGEKLLKTGVYKRNAFMKSKLKDMFENADTFEGKWHFDDSLTEQQNLFKLGLFPVYNSGCWKFVKDI